MATSKIEALLKEAMGLDAASIGSSCVERAVQVRSVACGAANVSDYWERLRASPGELQEIIELVVVPETWFFRDREAFTELARITCHEWQRHPTGMLRFLSLPCSTGEEPYSMAMALLDAGCPSDRFAIDAVDISERSLAYARLAIYGKNSFRGGDLAFCERHFQKTADCHQLNDAVRQAVRFHYGNIQADGFLAGAEPYDAIFCRNLLIYFDQPTQRRAIAVLQRLLSATGVLFVGPAEASLLLNHDFVSAKVPLAFAFRRAQRASPARVQARSPAVDVPAANAKIAAWAAPRGSRTIERAGPERPPTPPPEADIERAFALADQGRLTEAAALCETHLSEHGPSAQAFYLMGLICSADGRLAAADRCYRKALYLDKKHHHALIHLALLLEQQGDTREAKILRRRAQKP